MAPICCLALLLLVATPAERTVAEISSEIRARGNEIDPAVFDELAELKSREALKALTEGLGRLSNKKKICKGYAAMRHFAGVPKVDEAAADYLAACARKNDRQLALHAVLRLGGLGVASNDELFELALDHERRDNRSVALMNLVDRNMPLEPKQLKKLARSKNPAVRYEGLLAHTARQEDQEDRFRAITKLLRSKVAVERLVGVELLASQKLPGRLELLAAHLDDEDPRVARKAVASLERTRLRPAVGLLVARLETASRGERFRISRALVRLTGKDLGTESGRWQRWWAKEGATFEIPGAPAPGAQTEPSKPSDAEGGTRSFYGLPIYAEHLVFAADTSDSMKKPSAAEGSETRVAIAKRQVNKALAGMPEGGSFDIVNFGKSAWSWKGELVPARPRNVREAQKHVDYLDLTWGTEIYAALDMAFADPRADTVILLTDGDPQLSVMMDRGAIRRIVKQWNRTRHTAVDCLSIGTNRPWLEKLAEENDGRYRQVN